jgi:anti-sigma-K factor RskA
LREVFRSLFTSPAGLAFGALALLLLVFMAASNFLLWQRVNELQARVPPANVQLVRLAGTGEAPQAQGYLMVFNNETYGTLVVEHAPQLAPGYQYQLWLIRDGKRTDGGVFSVGKDGYGVLAVWADQPLGTFPSFGITIEPEGGSPAPTGKKVLGGDL